jgi:beta-N-acetylhexosaminidase
MGNYLRSLGFHVNFAPCLDTLTNYKNHLIADRALGVTSEQVSKLGKDILEGFHEAQILMTAKHFPGHGDTLADSHFELPTDDRDLSELERDALPPFLMASRLGTAFFMTAHVIYPKVDSQWPATLSKIWIQDIMRKKLKITQFCLADDLDMQALQSFGNANEIASRFFNIGGDFVMYCHRKAPPFEVLDYLKSHINPSEWLRLEESQKTLSRIKLAFA